MRMLILMTLLGAWAVFAVLMAAMGVAEVAELLISIWPR